MTQTEFREFKRKQKELEFQEELYTTNLCQIDECKFFETCDKLQMSGKKVKCVKYIHKLH